MSKGGLIQISNTIVRNPKINPMEFVLLLRLKYLSYTSGNKDEYEIDVGKIKSLVLIDDTRTIKKCFNGLYKNKYIRDDVEIKRKCPLVVKLNLEIITEQPFTQLNVSILDKIREVDYIGIRLLYYYESYILRKDISKQYCYPAIETIVRETGISKNTITRYNAILVKNKLLKIEKHKLDTEYSYNDQDELIFDRYNNHYYVRVDNI